MGNTEFAEEYIVNSVFMMLSCRASFALLIDWKHSVDLVSLKQHGGFTVQRVLNALPGGKAASDAARKAHCVQDLGIELRGWSLPAEE